MMVMTLPMHLLGQAMAPDIVVPVVPELVEAQGVPVALRDLEVDQPKMMVSVPHPYQVMVWRFLRKMMALSHLFHVMVQRLAVPMVQEQAAEAAQEVGVSQRLAVLLDQKGAVSIVDQRVAATKVAPEVV
jgi:hypothetical protein